jgi:hypothetical protein
MCMCICVCICVCVYVYVYVAKFSGTWWITSGWTAAFPNILRSHTFRSCSFRGFPPARALIESKALSGGKGAVTFGENLAEINLPGWRKTYGNRLVWRQSWGPQQQTLTRHWPEVCWKFEESLKIFDVSDISQTAPKGHCEFSPGKVCRLYYGAREEGGTSQLFCQQRRIITAVRGHNWQILTEWSPDILIERHVNYPLVI